MKERITITIDKGFLDWLDGKIADKVFANRSHALEFLIANFRKHENNLQERGIT